MCKGLLGLKFSGTVGSVLFACCKFSVSHAVQTINKNSDRKFPGGLRLLGWLHKGWAVLEGAVWVGSFPWEGKGGSEQLDDIQSRHWAVCVTVLWVGCSVFVSEAKKFWGKARDAEWQWLLPAILCVPHLSPLLALSHPMLVCPCDLRVVALGELPVGQRDPISHRTGPADALGTQCNLCFGGPQGTLAFVWKSPN